MLYQLSYFRKPLTWCPEQDSNLHASRHTHLKRARLPFRHNIHAQMFFGEAKALPDGGNYIGIECENFTGNIELNIE